jgi:Tfp pilus assembly protein FimT
MWARQNKMKKNGLTFIELTVYIVIFSILLGFAMSIFFWIKKTSQSTKRLDLLGSLRSSTFKIAQELSLATDIVFPGEDLTGETCYQIVYTDSASDLIAVFLREDGQLTRVNLREYEQKKNTAIQVLSRHAVQFQVIRRNTKYVDFVLTIEEIDEQTQKVSRFTYTNSARVRNHLN